MTERQTVTQPSADGLWRWLLGGLVGGGVILGLLIAAYAFGYHHGQHQHARAAPPHRPRDDHDHARTTTDATSPALGPVTVTPALVARGKALYSADGCSACHSLTGAAGVGPSFKGLAGSTVTLDERHRPSPPTTPTSSGRSPTLTPRSSRATAPGIMSAAIASFDLAASRTTSARSSPSSSRRSRRLHRTA